MVKKLRKVLVRYFVDMRWYTIVLALAVYSVSSWVLLAIAGEQDLLPLSDFFYWLIVTGSTVGYGDMSPSTAAGKLIVAVYVIPAGLSIFALILGRIAAWVSEQWRKGVRGLKPLSVQDHILVIGWNGPRTLQLLNLLLTEKAETSHKPDIILCVRVDVVNPMPGEIEFVRVTSFNQDEEMDKACVAEASVIIIDNPEDDMTMTTALYCSQRNPEGHKVAYFQDESLVKLLKTHCPNVECTPSVAVEMLAKSAFDPGSSLLHYDLLSLHDGQAQFSTSLPSDATGIRAGDILVNLKKRYNATFIGYVPANNKHQVQLNPDTNQTLQAGDKVFYIASKRIQHIDWTLLEESQHVQ